MAALYGTLCEFNPLEENISDYLDRVGFYLEANGVALDSKKRAVLLTVIGPQQFRLLKDLTAPISPGVKSFTELCLILKKHHSPAPPKFLCRAKFDQRTRLPNESISAFVAALRHLSEYCEFGESLNERLCEKFVTGVNHVEIQRKLVIESNLDLDKAIQIATSMLQSSEAARSLTQSVVNVVDEKRQSAGKRGNRNHQHSSGNNVNKCYRCTGPHAPHQCKFKTATCYHCKKTGHISKACFKRSQTERKPNQGSSRFPKHSQQHYVGSECPTNATEEENFNLFNVHSQSGQAIHVPLLIDSCAISFQLDTGASLTVISKGDYRKYFTAGANLKPSTKKLQTYTGDSVPVLGECVVNVGYEGQNVKLPLLVVDGKGPPLLGRNWLEHVKLDWSKVFNISESKQSVTTSQSLDKMLKDHKNVFGVHGALNDRTVTIGVKDTNPRYLKARVPPYAMKEKIEKELTRLEQNGIITRVESSEWATPIVPVLKKDGSVRICGDFKVTVNREIEQNRYPIPNIEDIAHKLAGGEKFTELDFSHAYTQLKLNEESKKYTTINTHKGLFRYERLCFGISSSPSIFQAVMDSIFQDIPNVCVYFDNVYITGKNVLSIFVHLIKC